MTVKNEEQTTLADRRYPNILYEETGQVAWVTSNARACSTPSASRRSTI
jgi:hypothetical protein